jgi:hypothetical protein
MASKKLQSGIKSAGRMTAKTKSRGIVAAKARRSRNYTSCDEVCESSDAYGNRYAQKLNPEAFYYAATVQHNNGTLFFVRFQERYLDISEQPFLFSASNVEHLKYMWSRIAIDDAIRFESDVDPTTFKIVRYSACMYDATEELGLGGTDFVFKSAIAKLTPAEAKVLGLDVHKAEQVFTRREDMNTKDVQKLKDLSQDMCQVRPGSIAQYD